MVTDNEGLSADELTTASDPISLRQAFWDALAIADESLAVEAASRVRPPPVVIQSFDFEDLDELGEDRDTAEGTLVLQVEPGSPGTVLNAWNSTSKTTLVRLDYENMCLVRHPTDKYGQGAGKKDFRACCKIGCTLVSHRTIATGGATDKIKLLPPEGHTGASLAIKVVPSNKGQTLETVFSRPLFCVDDLPSLPEGGDDTRMNILLKLSLKPVVFKFLFEGYPGRDELTTRLELKGLLSRAVQPFTTPRTSESRSSRVRLPLDEEVTNSPGLEAIITNLDEEGQQQPVNAEGSEDSSVEVQEMYDESKEGEVAAAIRRATPPFAPSRARDYPWNRDILSQPGLWLGEGDSSVTSLSTVGTLPRTAELQVTRLQEKLNTVTKKFNAFRSEVAQKDHDLGNVIYNLRVSENAHRQEIAELRAIVDELRSSSYSGTSYPRSSYVKLNANDKRDIFLELNKSLDLDNLVRKSDIKGFVGKSDLDTCVKFRDLADYVKAGVLNDYVSATQLGNFGYATRAELMRSMNDLDIPDRLLERFTTLEKEVVDPGGLVRTLEQSIKELSTKKNASEVSIGGVSFKDQLSTEAWAACLGDGFSTISYACDMVIQITGITTVLTTSAEVTQATANAIKAGFTSAAAAITTASFSLQFPETVFRSSQKSKDAGKGGVIFAPSFSSPDAFEGTAEFSAKSDMLSALSANRERHQRSINSRFPPDQSQHVKPNAVFSAILRMGYFQAVGFLESLLPFHKMMTQAGLSDEEAWGKCLTYARAVFARIFEVRTVASVHTVGSMLYGMMRATQMLQGYGELGWIRHPDVSSALVVAALQKEGKAVTEALAKAKAKDPQVATNKSNISALDNKIKELIRKNPTLNT